MSCPAVHNHFLIRFLRFAIFLNVSASVLALPLHPFLVMGVHLPLVPLFFLLLLTAWIQRRAIDDIK